MVIHMTRREGRRFVEEAAYVKGYDAKENKWDIERLESNFASKLKTKRSARIGVLILMGGMLALITEAQFEPRMKVARH